MVVAVVVILMVLAAETGLLAVAPGLDGGIAFTRPEVIDNQVFLSGRDNSINAFNMDTGGFIWDRPIGSYGFGWDIGSPECVELTCYPTTPIHYNPPGLQALTVPRYLYSPVGCLSRILCLLIDLLISNHMLWVLIPLLGKFGGHGMRALQTYTISR